MDKTIKQKLEREVEIISFREENIIHSKEIQLWKEHDNKSRKK